jgi:hypothetical protein
VSKLDNPIPASAPIAPVALTYTGK